MILRTIALKYVSGNERPTSFEVRPGTSFVELDPELAPAIPFVLMTLLYPDEVSSSDLARLAGSKAESGWRAEIDVAGRSLRISRGFTPASVLLEQRTSPAEPWARVAIGASDVRVALADVLKLPPPTVFEGLHAWVNVSPPLTGLADTIATDDVGELELVGTDALFDDVFAGSAPKRNLSPDDRARVADEYRRAKTSEFIADQIVDTERRLEEAIQKLGAVVDSTGELAAIQRALANAPEVRELTRAERDVFTEPERRREELERRCEALAAELAELPVGHRIPRPHLVKNALFMVGVGLTVGVTFASLFGGDALRQLAFGNIVAMGIAFAGYLRHVQLLEAGSAAQRRLAGLQRRSETAERERREFGRQVQALREELGMRSIVEVDEARTRRQQMLEKENALRGAHEAAFSSEAYKKQESRKLRVEKQLRALRQASARIGDITVPAFELGTELDQAGIDPCVVLWRPDDERRELDRTVKRLGQIASKYRLISESGLHPKTIASWLKVASRILGRPVEGLTLTAEHALVDDRGEPVLDTLSISEAVALVEALRMSLHLTLVKASAPGIHPLSIQVHARRVPDEELRLRLRKMYNGLGEKLQVVCIDTPT